jgi:hypothetical protein
MKHGTTNAYSNLGCRSECKAANTEHARRGREARGLSDATADHGMLSDLLHELFPDGLTDDAPRRKAKQAA